MKAGSPTTHYEIIIPVALSTSFQLRQHRTHSNKNQPAYRKQQKEQRRQTGEEWLMPRQGEAMGVPGEVPWHLRSLNGIGTDFGTDFGKGSGPSPVSYKGK